MQQLPAMKLLAMKPAPEASQSGASGWKFL
jgi:hypothetical protein